MTRAFPIGRSPRRRQPLMPLIAMLALMLSSVPWASTSAIEPDAPTQSPTESSAWRESVAVLPQRAVGPSQKNPKADWRVAAIAETDSSRGPAAALDTARSSDLGVVKGKIRLVIEASDLAQAKQSVARLGAEIEGTAGNLIQALIAPGQLNGLLAESSVRWVRPPLALNEAAVVDEAVATTNASAWHLEGLRGAGVKVAVIDGGFAGYTAAQASGDLPASLTTVDKCSGAFLTATDHGTAVAEIVHKMAPAAQLYLICIGTEVDLAQAELYAKSNGIQVINFSAGFYNSSRGDGLGGPGTPDATVADAAANGILWVNAAANDAQRHWSGPFVNDGSGTHLFTADSDINGFMVAAGATRCVYLKWDDWPNSSQDYDLYILNPTASAIVAASENVQSGTQPPTEDTCVTNGGATAQPFYVLIRRYSATAAPRFDLFVRKADGPIQHQVAAGSVTEPGSSPYTLAVGAICWPGTALELFSSRGPTIDGRIKPDLSGPDQVSTATYGPFSACSGSGFTGTSAAAPHVAGAAALVKGANPTFSTAQVRSYLEANARDLGAAGKDNLFGYGMLHLPDPQVIAPTPFTDIAGSSFKADIEWLYDSGITKGCSATLFCPDASVTRGQMAAFLDRALSLPRTTTDFFTDDNGTTFEANINRLAASGITKGCTATTFCPTATVTRGQMAAFLDRAFALPATTTDFFTDDNGTTFEANINRLAASGITTGCSATTYCPTAEVTRGQMAAFLHRALVKYPQAAAAAASELVP